eukprot:1298348-Alexandrium_andersonii.AAC.1
MAHECSLPTPPPPRLPQQTSEWHDPLPGVPTSAGPIGLANRGAEFATCFCHRIRVHGRRPTTEPQI